jgi:WD40 repeat protein
LWERGKAAPRELPAVDQVMAVAFAPEGKSLAWTAGDTTANLMALPNGALRTLSGHLSKTRAVSFSPDGRRLVTGADDRTARIWSLDDGSSVSLAHEASVFMARFSLDGSTLATVCGTQAIHVWDVEHGAELAVYHSAAGSPSGVAISPDGRVVATLFDEPRARLWPLATARPEASSRWLDGLTSVALTASGEIVSPLQEAAPDVAR